VRAALAALLLLLPGAMAAQNARRCLIRLLPGSNQFMRQEQFGNNVTVYLGGNVRFRCQGQDVNLGSDSVQIINENIYMLMGRAFYRDSTLAITADTLTYLVHAPNPAQDETVQARRDVKIIDRKTGSTLAGPSVDFLRASRGVRDSDEVLATGRPLVRYLPAAAGQGSSPPKPWRITADYLRGFGQTRLWGGGAVVVERDSLRMAADSLDVESGSRRRANFFGKPAELQRIGPDSFLVTGGLIRLEFAGDTLQAVRSFGAGAVTRGEGIIKGDSILIALDREKLSRTDVWGRPQVAEVHSSGYDAGGDSIVVLTPGEKLRELRAFGHGMLANPPDTTHPMVIDSASGGPPGRDTLWGNRIFALFAEADSGGTTVTRVTGIEAVGNAKSWYAYNAGGNNKDCPTLTYFLADTISVAMKKGDSTGVADVRYHGHVHGYLAERASVSSDSSQAPNPCRGKG
jgi:hypothetical protein